MDTRKVRRVDTGECVELSFQDGILHRIEACDSNEKSLPWVSAGWLDLQVNGIAGYDFNSETTGAEDILGVTRTMHQNGVTSYLPTVITGSFDRIRQALAEIDRVCRTEELAAGSIPGIHLEGPYISDITGPRGAHPLEHVRDPDWDEFQAFQEASGNRIRMVTLAPERKGVVEFIAKLKEQDIVVCIGHTAATREQIVEAVDAGASLSTHLGNGAHPILPRHPHYIWHQLAEDRLWASFIPDGHHLAPDVLKSMMRAKGGRYLFVSDCAALGGMPPGTYGSNIGAQVEVHADGRLTTAENPNILAGSGLMLPIGIANAVRYTGITLEEAIDAVTSRPASVMGWTNKGSLVEGGAADFTLFETAEDGTVRIVETIVHGKSVYQLQTLQA